MELTILMPCLNESESLAFCIDEAMRFLRDNNIDGEIMVSDNMSSDGSDEIAAALGAVVVQTAEHGYGSALRSGIRAAHGEYVIMADSDGSYDLYHLMPLLNALRSGADMVIGNRYKGRIEKKAFPWLHRYVGVPVLSFLGRIAARGGVYDFHCGLRGVNRESFLKLNAVISGMEFASEMIILSSRCGQRIDEVPVDIRRDKRENGKPHLRAVPDGMRHLGVILGHMIR